MHPIRFVLMGAVASASLLLVSPAAAKSDGYYTAQAKKEVSACLDAYDTGGNAIIQIASSVETVSACFAGGFITRVSFYTEPNCKPNQPCPLILSKLVAEVEFGCEDDVIYSSCLDNLCEVDEDCSDDAWCRQTEFGDSECTPYVQEGDSCGGFTLPWLYEQCEPSLVCTTDPFIPDLPGVCATCDYNGTPYAEGDSFPADDGCNTCFCGAGNVIGCTKIACLAP